MTDFKIQQAYVGLNTDNILQQLQEGSLTFAKNAMVENFDGSQITYQNEQGNEFCTALATLRPGYAVIGEHNIVEQNKTILFLHNPTTNSSEIGARINSTCIYETIINAECLNFNIDFPIHKVVVKTTNCNTEIYWTDGLNPRRWMDLDDLPFVEIPDPDREGSFIKDITQVDCNKLLVQPNFSIPTITPLQIEVGGDLEMGAYQFAFQYSNSLGEGYTSFYAITNPLGIFDLRYTQDFNLRTTQAIALEITNIDTSGLYEYFNLAAIKTVNNITSVELIGTFGISSPRYDLVYTGNSSSQIRLSMLDIFERFPYYDIAQDLTSSDNTLMWADLSVVQRINYGKFWSKVKLEWETWQVPYNKFEGYSNPINTGELRGYMRDEVYALEGCFILKNGKITESFHIPGPSPIPFDLDIINNADANNVTEDPCDVPIDKKRWQVYNTGSVTDFTDEYKANGDSDCYKGPYQYGKFSYWESEETYPNNRFIWDELAGQPIRHHRFPDCIVSPHYGTSNNEEVIFPIGIRINPENFYAALTSAGIAQTDLDQIQGFKIVRSNRVNNKSIIAKGLLYNVGKYKVDNQTYYYPNYPFNDLRPDEFIASSKVEHHSGQNVAKRLDGFGVETDSTGMFTTPSQYRYTFHSPDTSFYQPFGIDTGYLKLETVEVGQSKGHFVEVRDNAKYKFLTNKAIFLAFAAGMASMVSLDTGGGFLGVAPSITLDTSPIPTTFTTMLELIRTLAPAINYGYQFNSVGEYNTSVPVPNDGNKIRSISDGRYLIPGFQTVDAETINNNKRESSVYLKTASPFPFPHSIAGVPVDTSRYTLSTSGTPNNCANPNATTLRDISSYYASIKRAAPDQYGRMYSYETIDTGFYHRLFDGVNRYTRFPAVFGGDIFINRFALKRKLAFFLDDTVGKPNETDIALDVLGNIAWPIYFYGTNQIDVEVDFSGLNEEINILTDFDAGTIAGNLISGGVRPMIAGVNIMVTIFKAYLETLGVNNINLDCYSTKNLNELGKVYLFAYGIPYFFVESEVNVDFRQAINEFEGNYYPNVGTEIPDEWLQEVVVPIIRDNFYIYNKSYSKQNKETSFSHLKEDFDPNKLCQTNFPNRLIYSQKSNLEETKNNWLVYRPVSLFHFPKEYGGLTAIDGLEDRRLLVRFENRGQLYNVFATVNTSIQTAYLGNPTFFSQPPLDFAETETGYNGSQHKFLLKTEAGHLTIDSIRGQIFLFKGNQLEDIGSRGMDKFFTQNLPFKILNYFPTINIDNHFKDIGLTGVYDALYGRFLITKKDYIPIYPGITYDGSNFMLGNTVISVKDTSYFCNVGFTVSYNIDTQAWISFHSYIPDYYIAHPSYFETGRQQDGIWRHGETIFFNRFYGQIEDYILEYPVLTLPQETILSSFSDETTVLKYDSPDVFYEVEDGVYFNQAVIYNNMQCSGIRNLITKPKNNLAAYFQYPKFNTDSIDILVTKSDNLFSFNSFWNIVKEPNVPFFTRSCDIPSLDRKFNVNLDYTIRSHQKTRMRSTETKIRLIYNQSEHYKLISKFVITETQKSYK